MQDILGPHLGVLKQFPGLAIPIRLADQIESQLRSRAIQELEWLSQRLSDPIPRIDERSEVGNDSRLRVLRQLDQGEAGNALRGGVAPSVAALLNLRGMNNGSRDGSETTDDATLLSSSSLTSSPMCRLSRLFQTNQYEEVSRHLHQILALDQEGIRGENYTKSLDTPPEATYIPPAAPRDPLDTKMSLGDPHPRRIQSSVLALSTWASKGSDTSPGMGEAGIDLAISLRRLMSWFGQGWEQFQADARGRRL